MWMWYIRNMASYIVNDCAIVRIFFGAALGARNRRRWDSTNMLRQCIERRSYLLYLAIWSIYGLSKSVEAGRYRVCLWRRVEHEVQIYFSRGLLSMFTSAMGRCRRLLERDDVSYHRDCRPDLADQHRNLLPSRRRPSQAERRTDLTICARPRSHGFGGFSRYMEGRVASPSN